MIGVVDLPWFIAFFVAGSVVLGFNALKDWRARVAYPIFDVLMVVFLVLGSFIYGIMVPTVLFAVCALVIMYSLAYAKFLGEGDIYPLTWAFTGLGFWFGTWGLLFLGLLTSIGLMATVIILRRNNREVGGNTVPLLPSLFVGFVLANLLLYILRV